MSIVSEIYGKCIYIHFSINKYIITYIGGGKIAVFLGFQHLVKLQVNVL